jgi:hypothetical protein
MRKPEQVLSWPDSSAPLHHGRDYGKAPKDIQDREVLASEYDEIGTAEGPAPPRQGVSQRMIAVDREVGKTAPAKLRF